MQRILSLPVLALLALAFSTLMANGFIDRRQTANLTTESTKAPPATATDLKPVTDSSTGTEAHPAGTATDSKASTNTSSTSALPTSALPTTGTTSTSGSITTPPAAGAANTGGATMVMPNAANHSTSSVSHDKSTNTTKTVPPAGAKHSSAGQISCHFVVTFVVASLSLFAALFT